MLVFTMTELMLFAGLVSAFTIYRSSEVAWPPPGQPRLPFASTVLNTLALLLSGVCLYWAHRAHSVEPAKARGPLQASFVLGAAFVLLQGAEWVALIGQGLTLTSHNLGSFFYLVIGLHGLHALAALLALGWVVFQLRRDQLRAGTFFTVQVFWYFVVGIWPILYWRVYL